MRHLIRNALIVTGDGTAEPFAGDALIDGERIAHLGAVPPSAADGADRVTEAEGRVLTPGFIDCHNHGALGGTRIGAKGVIDSFITAYIPIGSLSTLALHYFQSDAVVDRPGLIDSNQIGLDNFGCLYATTCSVEQKNTIDTFVAENRYGTSTSLGGLDRLRSYPLGRFQGAHTIFYAVEFRWNLTEEATPFNYFIWKDVRTGLQVAFFAETGSVADTKEEVGNTFASSYGVGFRLVSGSGNVYRADLATGDEGAEVTVIFTYPWGPS